MDYNMEFVSEYPSKLEYVPKDAPKKQRNEWIKLRTLELYSYLPQTTLEERDSYHDIRNEIVELNDNFFWYIARSKTIINQSVTVYDKYQSAILHFMNNRLWAKFMFSPEHETESNRGYRTDLAFTSFFKPRITECMERELNNVGWSLRRSLCMKAGEQLGKKGTEVTYEDLANVHLPYNEMEALMSIFCTMNNADINDVSLYKPASAVVSDSIDELYTDEYDSIEDLIVHEMLEREKKLEDSYLLKMSQMYSIPYDELVKARPIAEEKLKRELEETIYVQETFNYSNEFFADGDE